MEISPAKNECSKCAENQTDPDAVCSSKPTVEKIKKELKIDAKSDKDTMKIAKKILGCGNSEVCVLEKLKDRIGFNIVLGEFDERFLPRGPANSEALLNNVNIDSVLKQWALLYPNFEPFEFAMIDFAEYGHPINKINIKKLIENGIDCFGLVFNTDVMSGGGKHWITSFGDMRSDKSWTVEFFNSSGNSPTFEIVDWMSKTVIKMENVAQLNTKVSYSQVSALTHQQSETECGVYSLYYIYSRLNKVPHKYFAKNVIKDADMYKFRKELFRV
jgi:hypothetical protein